MLNASTVEALEVGDSTKGLARTDVITVTVELLETEDGQDEFGLQRRQILKEMLSEFEEDDSNHVIEKRNTDPGYVSRHMKQDSLGGVDNQGGSNHENEKRDTDPGYVSRNMKQDNPGAVDSQDSHSKEVDKPDMGTYNGKEGEKVLKKDDQSHSRKLVDIKRISDNQPYNEAESLPQQVKTGFQVQTGQHEVPVSVRQYRSLLRQVKTGPHVWTGRHGVSALVLRQALMSGQVDTGFQFCTLVKSLESTFNNTASPHVRTNRHGALVLFASEELGTSVWAKVKANKIFIFLFDDANTA